MRTAPVAASQNFSGTSAGRSGTPSVAASGAVLSSVMG